MNASGFFSAQKRISPYQAAIFRILLGLFFVIQACQLHRAADGLLPGSHAFLLGIMAFFLVWGRLRKIAAIIIWLLLAWVYLRQPLLEPVAAGLTGLLLLFQILLPAGEGLQFRALRASPAWRFPAILFWGSWVLLAVYYGWNGILMALSPSWAQGTAVKEILQSVLVDEGCLRRFLLGWSESGLEVLSYVLFVSGFAFFILSLFRKTRPWSWLFMLLVQIFWFFLLNDGMGSLGLILFQLWIFDPDWFAARKKGNGKSLVLYDGVCGLCNGTVQFLLREDHEKSLAFSPLQGRTAGEIFGEKAGDNLSSVVYVRDWRSDHSQRSTHSEAVLQILKDLGGFWRVVSWLRFVPRPLRDLVYRGVAKVRYRVFGKYESCPLPGAEDRARFLD